MNKFVISELPKTNEENPVLYKVFFSDQYYLHKGKILGDSVNRFLDDIFRGIRGKSCPESYSEVVAYCQKHPSQYKVSVQVVLNAEPDKILRKEAALYKSMKKDSLSLNRTDIEPYKPEWMLKQSLGKRCDTGACITSGSISGKTKSFRFCPNCGRLNK